MRNDANTTARFGLIACSSIARRRFLPALLASSGASLEHVGSRTPERARALADEFGCTKAGSYEDVLADPDVNCVYISTPPTFHKRWVIEAASNGKHVLCEKPAAMNMADAREATGICRSNNVCFLEGYSFAFHTQHAEFRKRIHDGIIGRPRLFTGQFTYPAPGEGNYRFRRELGGGVFFDSAGYPAAAALMTMSRIPSRVFASFENDDKLGVDVGVSMMLSWNDGATALLNAGMGMQYRSRYAAHGANGRMELERAYAIDPAFAPALLIENDKELVREELKPADQFKLMIEHFARGFADINIRREFEDRFLRLQAVMDAALTSARTGKPVAVAIP